MELDKMIDYSNLKKAQTTGTNTVILAIKYHEIAMQNN
jgi:hypothetical protein